MRVEIKDVLDRLEKVEKRGNGWTARCPVHNDEKPSLSINEDNGKILLKCFAGCSFPSIVHALGINEREQNEQKRIVAQYDYIDENGEVLYQSVRYEPKDFRLRKPDGKGGYDWKLGDTKRVIYNLPQILKANQDDYVIFCEGEKDADNVSNLLGLPSTTIANGAKSWKEYYADSFIGLNVVILPDNDEAGKEFAEKVANSLSNKAKSVKIVNLPHLAEKGDVSDWIENGGTPDDLLLMIDNTGNWKPKAKEEPSIKATDLFIIKTANEFIKEAKQRPVPKMLFGELWFESEISILFADSNVGKSILAVQIADSITKGKQIGNFPLGVDSQKVLYFDFELTERQFSLRYSQQHFDQLVNEYEFSKNFLRAEINPDGNFGNVKFEDFLLDYLESYLEETDVKILIIDNITYLRSNTEKAKDASPLMQKLKSLKNKYGLSVLVLAHTPKRDLSREITINDLAGSKMLMNFCDSAFSIGKSSKDEKVRYIKQIKERNTEKVYGSENVVICELAKDSNFLGFNVLDYGNEREHLASRSSTNIEQEREQALALAEQKHTQREIARIMGISPGKVNKLLNFSTNSNVSTVQPVHSVHPLYDMNNVSIVNGGEMDMNE